MPRRVDADEGYRTALLDWMACAVGGAEERAARGARDAGDGLIERVAWLGTAGHVLDFDDTYLPGIAHLSAPAAPAALAMGAQTGGSVGDILRAFAAGFEVTGALSRASHPALYEAGWHPTAVCGAVGAATAAGDLLGLDQAGLASAQRLALLQAGGMRAAFGSDGKAIQVGMAAAAGVLAARSAAAGAEVGHDVVGAPAGFSEVFGGTWAEPDPDQPAVAENWIKPWPCCLMAHSAVEAATRLKAVPSRGKVVVTVHPVARAAATYDDAATGLQAKFSIPYLVAYTLLHGEPGLRSFDEVEPKARKLARRVKVVTDDSLGEPEAVLEAGGETVRVKASRGSPRRPLKAKQLAAKVHELAGERLDGLLDEPQRPAMYLLAALS